MAHQDTPPPDPKTSEAAQDAPSQPQTAQDADTKPAPDDPPPITDYASL